MFLLFVMGLLFFQLTNILKKNEISFMRLCQNDFMLSFWHFSRAKWR